MEVFLILLSYSPRNIFASIHTNLGYCFSTFSTVKIWYHTAAYFSSTIVPCTQCKAANNTQLSNQAKEAYFKRIKMYIYCLFTKWVVTKKIKLKYPSREGCKRGGLRGWARVVISPPRLSSSLLSPRPCPVPVPVPSSPPLSSPRPFRPRRPRVVSLSSTLDPPYERGLVAVVVGIRPVLVVVVPSSLSLSPRPRPVVVVPSSLSSLSSRRHSLVPSSSSSGPCPVRRHL